jgi:glycerol-3-phosphate cytidylyltransferase-like family protein
LDTREKIGPAAHFRRDGRPVYVVIGYFDPVHSAHVVRLEQLKPDGVQLVVAVLDEADAVLPLRARAELLAGLRAVDYVLVDEQQDLDSVLAELQPDRVIDERALDQARRESLIEHVVRRHQGR